MSLYPALGVRMLPNFKVEPDKQANRLTFSGKRSRQVSGQPRRFLASAAFALSSLGFLAPAHAQKPAEKPQGDSFNCSELNKLGKAMFERQETLLTDVQDALPSESDTLLNLPDKARAKLNRLVQDHDKLQGNFERKINPVRDKALAQCGRSFGRFYRYATENFNAIKALKAFLNEGPPDPATSPVRLVQEKIHKDMGITGKGVKVLILDIDKDHSGPLSQLLHDLAPGAEFSVLQPEEIKKAGVLSSDVMAKKLPDEVAADWLNAVSNQLTQITHRKTTGDLKDLKVINMSMGISKIMLYKFMFESITEERLDKAVKAVYGNASRIPGDERQIMRDVVAYTDNLIDNSDRLKTALKRYQDATAALAKSGVTLVTSAGNDQQTIAEYLTPPLKPGAALNFTAMSPSIIIAAATDHMKTPGTYGDDRMCVYSSQGNDSWQPTIAVTPENKYFATIFQPLRCTGGTSSSTLYSSAYVALLLEKNPTLTFEEVKNRLQGATVSPPDLAAKAIGAGIVDPIRLVKN